RNRNDPSDRGDAVRVATGRRERTGRCRGGRSTGERAARRDRRQPQSSGGFRGVGIYLQRRTARRPPGGAGGSGAPCRVRRLLAQQFREARFRHERYGQNSAHSGRPSMLSMLEEVVLLAVDERTGNLRATREFGTAYALVGAVFFDLALARKIDT